MQLRHFGRWLYPIHFAGGPPWPWSGAGQCHRCDAGGGPLPRCDILPAAQGRTRQLYRRHSYLPSGLFYLPDADHPCSPWAAQPSNGPQRQSTGRPGSQADSTIA